MLTQFLRYEPVARAVERAGGTTLLEVGGGSRGIVSYLPLDWHVTNCDLTFADYGSRRAAAQTRAARVVGSVLRLPFADSSFDIVVALDLVEHLGPVDRPAALRELARVTSRRAIIGCPCGEVALQVDRSLARLLARHHQPSPGWLDEHLQNGFPKRALLEDTLAPYGTVSAIPNTNVAARLALARLEMQPRIARATLSIFRRLAPAVRSTGPRRTRAAIAGKVLRGLDAPPVYRHIIVLDRSGDDMGGRDRASGRAPHGGARRPTYP